MARSIFMIEVGSGVDLQGQDATKAALRAVRDAIGRNYLAGLRPLLAEKGAKLAVHVRLGVPDGVAPPDTAAVAASLPHGEATVEVIPGGLLTPNRSPDGALICIVNAAVEVWLES